VENDFRPFVVPSVDGSLGEVPCSSSTPSGAGAKWASGASVGTSACVHEADSRDSGCGFPFLGMKRPAAARDVIPADDSKPASAGGIVWLTRLIQEIQRRSGFRNKPL
jgi:hypothetical protein